ncbi:MAG: TonB-dependent receptor, partial [Bacteroidales bacterium]
MKNILYITLCFFISLSGFAQQHFTISGYVKDKNTGEVLIGSTIYEKSLYKGTVTNGYGFYSLSLPTGEYSLTCSFMGYENVGFEINLIQNINKDIFLDNSSVNLEAVTVTAESSTKPLAINEFSTEKLTMKNIRQLPAMFGEADVIKAIQLQSGVKTLGDGSSGMFVRGGSSDQNLILIDEAPIYNPSHLFGLISVFNPDALNHVDLYKSNMPAQYGGRVSSVIDCKMKEGNMY